VGAGAAGRGCGGRTEARRGDIPMMRALLQFFSTVVVFVLLAQSLPGFKVDSWGSAILAALVLGLVNATLGTLLRLLAFPLILLTLGLFYFVVNAFVLIVVAFLVPGLHINGWAPALIASVALAALSLFWKMVPRGRRHADED
jgi:putative membrane protein